MALTPFPFVSPMTYRAIKLFLLYPLFGLLLLSTGVWGIYERYRDKTVFAPSFSWEKFDKVYIGMPMKEVLDLLGEPFLGRIDASGLGGVRMPVSKILRQSDIDLFYSKPTETGVNWTFTFISIKEGRVVEKAHGPNPL